MFDNGGVFLFKFRFLLHSQVFFFRWTLLKVTSTPIREAPLSLQWLFSSLRTSLTLHSSESSCPLAERLIDYIWEMFDFTGSPGLEMLWLKTQFPTGQCGAKAYSINTNWWSVCDTCTLAHRQRPVEQRWWDEIFPSQMTISAPRMLKILLIRGLVHVEVEGKARSRPLLTAKPWNAAIRHYPHGTESPAMRNPGTGLMWKAFQSDSF